MCGAWATGMTINRKTRRLSHQSWHGRHAPSHSIFKGPGAIRGPLFMRSKVYASIPFRAAGASAEAAIPPQPTRVIYAHNVCQTMRLQAKSQRYGCIRSRSGIRGEGDGVAWRGRGRGEQARGAAGSAAVRSGIDFVCFEDGVTVWRSGQDWCDSRYDFQVTGTTGVIID